MKNFLFLLLAQRRIFWRLRALLGRLIFSIERWIFGFCYELRDEKTNLQSLGNLLQITSFQLLFAIFTSVFLQIINPYLTDLYEYFHFTIPDDGVYVTLLTTISGIGGIFIGLYYAGLCTAAGAIYSRVPNNIRDLLARVRIGNVYMRYLAFVTLFSLCLVGLRVLGFPRIHLAVPISTLLAGIGIIAFVKLGQTVFYFFDPTRLSYPIFDDLRRYSHMVRAGGFQWNDRSFQNHANKKAKHALDTLNTLADLTAGEEHLQGKPFTKLAQDTLFFLVAYQKEKNQIPSESLWYEQRYIHPEWYRTEDSELSIAHQTGTSLQPKVVNDKLWVENRIFPIILHCIKTNLKAGRLDLVEEVFEYIDFYLKTVSQQGGLLQAFNNLDELAEILFAEIASPADKPVLKEEILEHLALTEHLATTPITILLSYTESLSGLNKKQVYNRMANIRWEKPIDLYRQGFFSYVLPRLEWVKPRLHFELSVEDKLISPLWYQTELVTQVEAEKLAENASFLISTVAQQYKKWVDRMNNANHPWLAASILSREWEYWNKARHNFSMLEDIWNNLSGDRYIEELPWPESEIAQWKQKVKDSYKTILKHLSQHSIPLLLPTRPEGFPDYGGQFLHTTGEAIIGVLLDNDLDLFKAIFKPYFYGCLMKFDELRPKSGSTDWRTQREFKIAAAPLLDIMEISGYARLLADFHGKPELWTEIKDVWDKYIDSAQISPPITNLFAGAILLTEIPLELPHRSEIRMGWKLKIYDLLRTLPKDEIYHSGYMIPHDVVLHESSLVRIFSREPLGTFYDGIDIFIALYLSKRPEAKDIKFGRKRDELEKSLERDEQQYKRYVDSKRSEE